MVTKDIFSGFYDYLSYKVTHESTKEKFKPVTEEDY